MNRKVISGQIYRRGPRNVLVNDPSLFLRNLTLGEVKIADRSLDGKRRFKVSLPEEGIMELPFLYDQVVPIAELQKEIREWTTGTYWRVVVYQTEVV